MDFNLPESALAVRDGVAAVAAKYDNAYWSRCEEEHRFPDEVFSDLGNGGWLGLCIPEEYGGGGQGLLELAVANDTLCASGGTQGTFIYVTTPGFGAMTLVRHGTEEQKQKILPGLAEGKIQFCFALTEPDAGSNAIEITTAARRDGDDFLIKGQKVWISNVERADWMVAVTRTIPAADAAAAGGGRTNGFTLFLIDVKEALAAGTLSYTPIPKMGSNILASSQVFFDDVRVPAENVLGEVDKGFGVLWDVLNPERILAAAGGVGSAKTEMARLMTYKAAWLFDNGQMCGNEANVAKLTGAQVAWEAADQAFQTLGGMAYSKEYPIERMFRDARIGKNIPVSEQLVLAHIGTSMLGLPKSY
jgi:acyl-CoA dehydrogenase